MSVLNPTTSTTRPSNPSDGELFFETDTRKILLWDGSAWREYDNTTGATSGSGTGDSGSGSGSGDSGGGSGSGGTTPGAGSNIATGIIDSVAQPGSNHSNSDSLGDDTSTGDINSISPLVGTSAVITSSDIIDAQSGGRISWNNFQDFNNTIMSFWVRFDDEFENLATGNSNTSYKLWNVTPTGSVQYRGLDWSYGNIVYQKQNGRIQIQLGNQGLTGFGDMLNNQQGARAYATNKPPFNPYVAHNADGGETRTGHSEPETMDWQEMEQPFHKDRWYHIAFNWHRQNPNDWTSASTIQYIDTWIDGIKQSTTQVRTNGTSYNRFSLGGAFSGDFIVGGAPSFPGLIQRFSQYKYTCPTPSDRLFDDDMKALYALGAESTNPMFKSDLPANATLKCFDTLLGDDNQFPGNGNSIPIKMWERTGSSTGDNEVSEGVNRSNLVPYESSKSFEYVKATYNKPYTIGFGTWNGQEYSDGILNTGYKTNMAVGGTAMLWVNISNVDKNGVQYLFGSKNSPDAFDRDGNNPDQFAIGVEQALGSTACRFKLFYMQEDETAPVFEVHNNEWHCIALMVDPVNNKASFYHNGVKSKEFTNIQSSYSGNQLPPFYIGDANGADSKMEGLISRVHYYSGVWTASELLAFYQAGPGATSTPQFGRSTLDYPLDGRMVNIGGANNLYPNLTYTGTGKPKYARSKPY